MMFEVQNGTVQTRNNPIGRQQVANMKDQKIGDPESEHKSNDQHNQL